MEDPPRTSAATTAATADDESSRGGPGADALRRLLNMGGRRPPPVVNAGQVIGERFRIERKLGAGGMGVVYLARDLTLGRDVAIKFASLALPDRAGLPHREATALARLVHPNVVTVYEIGVWNDHAFVAMEYVPGGTARTWLAAEARSARAIVGLYLDAARGLAAAHEAGLVHRDFKPDNVLVGNDGRARVADFGLARDIDESDDHASVGTPAYMAPEQRARGRVGPAADQFSFAVALREALAATPRVPPHLERALQRALSSRPDDRFPSMHALVAELERDPEARRRRGIAIAATVGGGALVAALATWATVRGARTPPVSCDVGADALAGIWDPDRRAAMAAAFGASQRVDADQTFARVAALLDERARAWSDARAEACAATHQRGTQSAQLLDLRMACLDRRKDELRAAVYALTVADADVVDRAIETVAGLRPLAACSDATALLGAPALPIDPERRANIAAIEQRAAEVDAIRATGRIAVAAPLAAQIVVDARQSGYPPLVARAALVQALTLAEGDDPAAEASFLDSIAAAAAAHDDQAGSDGWRGLVAFRGARSQTAGADVLVAAARAAAARLDPDGDAVAALDLALVPLRWRQGDLRDMLARATAAHDWFAAKPTHTLDEGSALLMLGTALEQNEQLEPALARTTEAAELLTRLLGVDHPKAAEARRRRAKMLVALQRFDEARADLAELAAAMDRAYGADSSARARVDLVAADVEFWQGHYQASVERARAAQAALRRDGALVEVAQAQLMIARAWSGDSRPQRARDAAREALVVAESITPPNRQILISTLNYLGITTAAVGDLAGSQTYLDRALALGTELYGSDGLVVAQIENARAANFATLGDHVRATAGYQRAIEVGMVRKGAQSIDVLYARNNLAYELAEQGRWDDAVPHLEQSVAGLERVLGADHPTLCAPLALLAYAYAMVGRSADGVRAAERGLAIRAARGEPNDPNLQLGLGAALWAGGVELDRGRALVAAAARTFRAGAYDASSIARADGWLRTHRLTPRR